MGESQWFQPTVVNNLSQAIILANFSIQYGKFYNIRDPYQETASAQGTKIEGRGDRHEWGHCGREFSPTGTEGSFEIHLDGTGEKVAEIYWDCPYLGRKQLIRRSVKPGYKISFDDFSIGGEALGKGTISIAFER